MSQSLSLGDETIEVVRKPIKNIHLSVLPPSGAVRVSAPMRVSDDLLKSYVISKLPWVRKQQAALRGQTREAPREFVNRESHYVWGERYLLELKPNAGRNGVEFRHDALVLSFRGDYAQPKAARALDKWYRTALRAEALKLISFWEPKLDVAPNKLFIQRLKTRWGGCSPATGNIRLNLELAKKPKPCLEYILVHELLHLIEPTHNQNFKQLLKRHMPAWKERRDLLNALPLRHEDWAY